MKKSVILIILVIYVASIIIVGVFGTKTQSYYTNIYVTKIECTNEEARVGEMEIDGRMVPIKLIKFDINEQTAFRLQWKVFPEDATNRTVKFSMSTTNKATIDEVTGLIQFTNKCTVTVYITSTDGSNIVEIVKVTAWPLSTI